MKKQSLISILALALALPTFTGCIAVESHTPPKNAPTVGQQLIDLQRARDSGALSEAEFQQQKAKLLSEK